MAGQPDTIYFTSFVHRRLPVGVHVDDGHLSYAPGRVLTCRREQS
jgi:hypothetical protein